MTAAPIAALLLGSWPFLFGLPYGVRIARRIWPEAEQSPVWFMPVCLIGGLAVTIGFTFLLLTLGWCSRWVLVIASLPSLVLLIRDSGEWRRRFAGWFSSSHNDDDGEQGTSDDRVSVWLCWGISALLIVLSAIPAMNYDAHEYHLAVPEQYLEAGGWTAPPRNVFGGFPMNVELLYLWGLTWGSIAAATVVHTILAIAAGVTCAGIARSLGVGNPALACLLYLSTSLVQTQCIHANIDHGPSFFAAVAVLGLFSTSERRRGPIAFAGLALGMALGGKYVSILSVAAPAMVVFLLESVRTKRLDGMRCAILFGGAAAVFLPWLMRNAMLYGNPVHPLLPSWFGYSSWDAIGAALFQASVSPKSMGMEDRIASLIVGFQKWTWGMPLTGDFGDAGYFLRQSSGHIGFLGVIGVLAWQSVQARKLQICLLAWLSGFVAWMFFTQGADRFLMPLFPLLAVAGAAGLERIPRHIGRIIAWAGSLTNTTILLIVVHTMMQPIPYLLCTQLEHQYLSERMPHFRAIQYFNHLARNNDIRVLFVGEAQDTGARFPRIVTVVYNQHPLLDYDSAGNVLAPDLQRVKQKLAEDGVTHLFFNVWELKRLTEGYGPLGWQQGDPLRQLVVQLETEGVLQPVPESVWDGETGYTIYLVHN